MSDKKHFEPDQPSPQAEAAQSAPSGKPDWVLGLRQLYDSVVEEPLPDTFRELLSKLDK